MKSIKLKTTCHGNHVHTELANPLAPLGDLRNASVQIRQVNNIPDEVGVHEVIRKFLGTSDITYLGGRSPRLEFDYAELGIGVIISR